MHTDTWLTRFHQEEAAIAPVLKSMSPSQEEQGMKPPGFVFATAEYKLWACSEKFNMSPGT